jgi:hypothetical protein
MIDLPTQAEVHCSDGIFGRSTYIIGNPINRRITHLVVQSILPPFREYLVPVDQVEETTDSRIKLKCTRDDLNRMDPFLYDEYIPAGFPEYLSWPYVLPARSGANKVRQEVLTFTTVTRQNIPEGELALRRGARVEATDGYVGQVDELLINSKDMQVTHLMLLERHILQKREITIPVSQIDHIDQGTVYLKLDRQGVETLPTTPVQRWTRSVSRGGAYIPVEAD